MSKTKKILLLLSTIISVSISAVSIYYLSLYYKLDQPNYVNLSDEEEKQLIYLKNSFNEFIFKKIQNNFNKYQKEYFMSTY
ncbi:hypothetical protein JIY74_34900 [Vibrio harveyi]|nr:hypothetical protein [Vibrio harveyi]